MMRSRLAALALLITLGTAARAQGPDVCHAVAYHLWTEAAAVHPTAQTPLAELTAAAPGSFKIGESPTKPDRSIADALIQDHAADAALAAKLRDQPPGEALRFGNSDRWLLDRVEGSLGCHTPMVVAAPPDGPAHAIDLPGSPDPSALCALSALTAVAIDGTPSLWIEQSGGFSSSLSQSTISIAALRDGTFAPPCSVVVDYVVTDRATHAFCDGVDCVPLILTAEILAMRLRQEENAESLGAGVLQNQQEEADYRHMAEMLAADTQPADLPTFGASLDTPFIAFSDQVVFPLRLAGGVYIARMGHGGSGWRQSADTLLALYRLRDERLVPAASVYVAAQRTAIGGVTVQ